MLQKGQQRKSIIDASNKIVKQLGNGKFMDTSDKERDLDIVDVWDKSYTLTS